MVISPFDAIVIFAARSGSGSSQLRAIVTQQGRSAWAIGPRAERAMTSQDDEEKKNMRIMWIASGVVVLGILGLMLTIGEPTRTTSPTDTGGQSQTTPPQ